MNYLAHLLLAPDTAHGRLGALLGDFCRGADLHNYAPDIACEIQVHRLIDTFTDQHATTLHSKALFSSRVRRYAGIFVDMYYDHLLARHWSTFHTHDLQSFALSCYRQLREPQMLTPAPLPPRLLRMLASMIEHDWLQQYAEPQGIAVAIERMSHRVRGGEAMQNVMQELQQHDMTLETNFLTFFPQLIEHARLARTRYVRS